MKTIHYSKEQPRHHVLAEQLDDLSWQIEGYGHCPLADFRYMYTDEAPHRYEYYRDTRELAPDPNSLVRGHTHELQECDSESDVRALEDSVPGVQFLEPATGTIYRDLPVYFSKTGPIAEFEEIPVVGADLPLIAIVPVP